MHDAEPICRLVSVFGIPPLPLLLVGSPGILPDFVRNVTELRHLGRFGE